MINYKKKLYEVLKGTNPQIMSPIIQLWSSIIEFMEQHFKLCSSTWIMGLHRHLHRSMNNYALKMNYMELHNLNHKWIII